MEYLIVGIGGVFGSIFRYSLGKIISENVQTRFPLGTFLINISGAIILGFINGIGVHGKLLLLLADGFLGAYTTFSTFMFEGYGLIKENNKFKAVIYIGGSLLFGILGFILGSIAGKLSQ